MRKRTSEYERFMALSDAEKDREVGRYDRETSLDDFRPLTGEMRRQLRRAKGKRGRPRIGRGARKVLVSIERGLLEKADAAARARHVSRSQLFARGLEAVLAECA
jgi:hypothetical protein